MHHRGLVPVESPKGDDVKVWERSHLWVAIAAAFGGSVVTLLLAVPQAREPIVAVATFVMAVTGVLSVPRDRDDVRQGTQHSENDD